MTKTCDHLECFSEGDHHYYVEINYLGFTLHLCKQHKHAAFEVDVGAQEI